MVVRGCLIDRFQVNSGKCRKVKSKDIRAHLTDNTDKLLLAASRFPGIDIRFAIDQIIARRQIQHKLPFWYEHFIYKSRQV